MEARINGPSFRSFVPNRWNARWVRRFETASIPNTNDPAPADGTYPHWRKCRSATVDSAHDPAVGDTDLVPLSPPLEAAWPSTSSSAALRSARRGRVDCRTGRHSWLTRDRTLARGPVPACRSISARHRREWSPSSVEEAEARRRSLPDSCFRVWHRSATLDKRPRPGGRSHPHTANDGGAQVLGGPQGNEGTDYHFASRRGSLTDHHSALFRVG